MPPCFVWGSHCSKSLGHKRVLIQNHSLEPTFLIEARAYAPNFTTPTILPFTRGTPFLARVNAFSSDVFTACTDRKSTRLNSSHQIISYAVFCLKKKISILSLK